ncbi:MULTISPECIES: Mov34/MPN/PAD-1 family protein [unclassified Sporosarcina]|uniref:Mov34/MPN/PAD-1 family protein n=1 Tax=unclassified Sporosarcina TaxID=2647733 RepID=UPI0018EB1D2B|nr:MULTISPECIES: Mov34/MPN/PAD-1 family protein [unclassified Sporosarcina]
MIKLILPRAIEQELKTELIVAGTKEIGGVLLGEHVSEGVFRISDFTIQRSGGTVVSFIRHIHQSLKNRLSDFFNNTKHNYTKFNYLGEWHSHPSFELTPSIRDRKSMRQIVNDPTVGANFVMLLLVKSNEGEVEGSVSIFVPGNPMFQGELIKEEAK